MKFVYFLWRPCVNVDWLYIAPLVRSIKRFGGEEAFYVRNSTVFNDDFPAIAVVWEKSFPVVLFFCLFFSVRLKVLTSYPLPIQHQSSSRRITAILAVTTTWLRNGRAEWTTSWPGFRWSHESLEESKVTWSKSRSTSSTSSPRSQTWPKWTSRTFILHGVFCRSCTERQATPVGRFTPRVGITTKESSKQTTRSSSTPTPIKTTRKLRKLSPLTLNFYPSCHATTSQQFYFHHKGKLIILELQSAKKNATDLLVANPFVGMAKARLRWKQVAKLHHGKDGKNLMFLVICRFCELKQ